MLRPKLVVALVSDALDNQGITINASRDDSVRLKADTVLLCTDDTGVRLQWTEDPVWKFGNLSSGKVR